MLMHDTCWIDRARAAIDSKPKLETRGRRKVAMEDNTRIVRLQILKRRASVVQRIKAEISKPPGEQNTNKIIYLGSLLYGFKAEIEPYGGAPKSW